MAEPGEPDQAKLVAALRLLQRLPPKDVKANLKALTTLLPNETDDLLEKVDQPLVVRQDPSDGNKSFLLCDYNRDGDSFRSPHSNSYFPSLGAEEEEAYKPPAPLRQLEVEANEIFGVYRELYYGPDSFSSVYMWDLDDGFAACFLVKKDIPEASGGRFVSAGAWDGVHIVEVSKGDSEWHYRLNSTATVRMVIEKPETGRVDLAGSANERAQRRVPIEAGRPVEHLTHMGQLVEETETSLRTKLESIHISKMREITDNCRQVADAPAQGTAFVGELNAAILRHGAAGSGGSGKKKRKVKRSKPKAAAE